MRRSARTAVSTLAALLALVVLLLLAPLLPDEPATVAQHATRWVWGALLAAVAVWSCVLMYRNGAARRPPPDSPARARDRA